jgi:hypothetical protein
MGNFENTSPLFRKKTGAPDTGIWAIPERVFSRLIFDPNSGCWLWDGLVDKDGYGLIKTRRKVVRVHTYLYRLMVGEIPVGKELDHFHCSRRRCGCPDHVRPVTHAENVRRSARWPRKLV